AGEVRFLRTEQDAPHRGVDAVGADQHIGADPRSVLELGLDAIAMIDEAGQAVPDVQALGRERTRQAAQHVGTMHLIMRRAERGLHGVRDRRAQQRSAVLPAALMPGERLDPHARQRVRQAEPVQDARGIGADLDAGADPRPARSPARRPVRRSRPAAATTPRRCRRCPRRSRQWIEKPSFWPLLVLSLARADPGGDGPSPALSQNIAACTRSGGLWPSRKVLTLMMTFSPMSMRPSIVAEPMCGRATTRSLASSFGLMAGSFSNTSRPAPAIWPASTIRASSFSSITSPRAVLTM